MVRGSELHAPMGTRPVAPVMAHGRVERRERRGGSLERLLPFFRKDPKQLPRLTILGSGGGSFPALKPCAHWLPKSLKISPEMPEVRSCFLESCCLYFLLLPRLPCKGFLKSDLAREG